jgi:competence protein ComFB
VAGGTGDGARGVTNVTLETAQREYERLRPQYTTFCGCDTCRGDVLVYALNRLSPHYVSTRAGEIITGLTMGTDQETAKLTVILIEGFRRVALAPRCGAKAVNLP